MGTDPTSPGHGHECYCRCCSFMCCHIQATPFLLTGKENKEYYLQISALKVKYIPLHFNRIMVHCVEVSNHSKKPDPLSVLSKTHNSWTLSTNLVSSHLNFNIFHYAAPKKSQFKTDQILLRWTNIPYQYCIKQNGAALPEISPFRKQVQMWIGEAVIHECIERNTCGRTYVHTPVSSHTHLLILLSYKCPGHQQYRSTHRL